MAPDAGNDEIILLLGAREYNGAIQLNIKKTHDIQHRPWLLAEDLV
jgi:hypothetical protein